MKKGNLGFTILCICYLLFFLTMGVYTPYLNLYYERVGLTGSQMGTISSAGYIAAMLFSPLWGAITDKTHKYKAMASFLILATGITGLIWQRQTEFLWIFVASLFLSVFRSNIGNVLDALCVEYSKQNNKEFSLIRSMGSLGYLAGSFIVGNFMFEFFHIQGPYMQVLFGIALLFVCLMLFVKEPEFSNEVSKDHNLKSNMKELLHNHDYIFILFLSFFSMMILDSTNNYIGNHLIMTMGLEDNAIGIVTCAMVLPEIFIIMNFHKLIKKFGTRKTYLIAIVTQIIRCAIYTTTSNLYVFMLASVVHGFMVGSGTVCIVSYIHKKVPTYMLATAMTIYGGFTVVGYALQSQLFGIIYQLFGSHMIFITTIIFTVIALFMVLRTKRFDD